MLPTVAARSYLIPKEQKFHCEYCLNIYTEEEVTRYMSNSNIEAHLENPSTTTAEENLSFHSGRRISATQQTGTTENENNCRCEAQWKFLIVKLWRSNCHRCNNKAATYCYYCHNPVVLAGRLSGEFYQKMSLPFYN